METETAAPRPPSNATAPVYARKATGMVREVSSLDMVVFNAAAAGGGGIALVIGLFYVFGSFPGANLYLALLVALAVVGFVWMAFALMSAVFPRAGGDYLFGSRVLHPIVGLASNLGTFASTLLATGLWGVFMTTIGLAPAFAIIGVTTGNSWWTTASATISQKGWTFGIAVAFVVVMSVLSIVRTRLITRVATWSFFIGFAGLIVALLVLLFTSHGSFVHHLNKISQPITHTPDTYGSTIAAGAKGGLHYHGYSFRSTIGAMYATLAVMLLFWWGTYMAGEMKQGGRRKRQLGTMFTAGFGQSILIILATVIFVKTIGYDFFAAANAGFYGVGVSPYYNYFAAVAAHSEFLSIVLGLTFLGFLVPGAYINFAMCQRALFAWSFDGLLPRRFSAVSDRTHTPVLAIVTTGIGAIACAYWVVYGSNVVTVLTVTAGLLVLPMVVTGIAAIVLPRRRPDLYAGSPADWRWRGVPVLLVSGIGCVLVSIFWYGLIIYFHKEIGVKSFWVMPALVPVSFLVGWVYYRVAQNVQARKGNRLEYVYKTIPPD